MVPRRRLALPFPRVSQAPPNTSALPRCPQRCVLISKAHLLALALPTVQPGGPEPAIISRTQQHHLLPGRTPEPAPRKAVAVVGKRPNEAHAFQGVELTQRPASQRTMLAAQMLDLAITRGIARHKRVYEEEAARHFETPHSALSAQMKATHKPYCPQKRPGSWRHSAKTRTSKTSHVQNLIQSNHSAGEMRESTSHNLRERIRGQMQRPVALQRPPSSLSQE